MGWIQTAWTGIKVAAGIGAGIGVADVGLNGTKDSWLLDKYQNVRDALKVTESRSGIQAAFAGFFEIILQFANMLGLEADNPIRNFAEKQLGVSDTAEKNGIPPNTPTATMPNGITTANTLSGANFKAGFNSLAEGNVGLKHKVHVVGHGLAEGGVHVLSVIGHGADVLDWSAGKIGDLTGWYKTDYANRDLSKGMHDGLMDNVVNPLIGAPELKTAWDRALHFTGELVPGLVAGGFLAPAFAGVAASSAASGTALGTAFGKGVVGLGLTGTVTGAAAMGANFVPAALENG